MLSRPHCPVSLFLGIVLLWGVSGCVNRRIPPVGIDASHCRETVEQSFGPVDEVVIAVRPARGGTVFTPETLTSLARVTEAFQRSASSGDMALRTLTTIPLFRPAGRGVDIVIIGENLPSSRAEAEALRPLVYSYEFAIGDLINAAGTLTWIHLPRVDFAGVDLKAMFRQTQGEEVQNLLMVMDDGSPEGRDEYRQVSGNGASADQLSVLFEGSEAGEMKEPQRLRVIQEFQNRAEQIPGVTQTYSVTEDIMLARRYLFHGNPAEGRIPDKKVQVSQALLVLQVSGNAEAFGTRISSDERVVLVRVGLSASKSPEKKQKLIHDILRLAQSIAQRERLRAVACP